MKIELQHFELQVPADALERGLMLYEGGKVDGIVHKGEGRLEAVVQDRDGAWHPALTVRQEAIVAAECSCGARDSLCGHLVAVVFAMEAGQFGEGVLDKKGKVGKAGKRGRPAKGMDIDSPKQPEKAPKPKKAKAIRTVADILNHVPHEALVEFLLKACKVDKGIENQVKAHFADLLPANSPEEVEKRISQIVKAATNGRGKINKGAGEVMLDRLGEWLEEAKRMVAAGEQAQAFAVRLYIYHYLKYETEWPEVLQAKATESYAETVKQLMGMDVSTFASLQQVGFLEVLNRYGQKQPRDYMSLLFLTRLVGPGEGYEDLERQLSAVAKDEPNLMRAWWEMVERVKGQAAAVAFAKQHQHTLFFIQNNLDEALAAGNLREAVKQARMGFKVADRHYQNFGRWADLEDELLEQLGDVQGRVEVALRLHRMGYRTKRISIQNIPVIAGMDAWRQARSELLHAINPRTWSAFDALTTLYAVGNDHEGLLDYFGQLPTEQQRHLLQQAAYRDAAMALRMSRHFAEHQVAERRGAEAERNMEFALRYLIQLSNKEDTLQFFKELELRHPRSVLVNKLVQNFASFAKRY